MKQHAQRAWNSYVEELFANFSIDSAIAQMYSSGCVVAKKMKYKFLLSALDKITPDQVYASWEMSGVCRAAWSAPAMQVPVVDIMSARCGEQVEIPIGADDIVETDGEDDADDEGRAAAPRAEGGEPPRQVPRADKPAQAPRGKGRPKKLHPEQTTEPVRGPLDILFARRRETATQQEPEAPVDPFL